MTGAKKIEIDEEWAREVLRDYIKLHEKDELIYSEDDSDAYDMRQRLRLAKMVQQDGRKNVVDLGSQFGGMTYALKRTGIENVISVEVDKEYADNIKEIGINDNVVCCDAFNLPEQDIHTDALISYMFLGFYARKEMEKGNNIMDIFERLSKSSDVIYSVELKPEYRRWFRSLRYSAATGTDVEDIKRDLENALGNLYTVEYLGEFGKFKEDGIFYCGRIGFKFTKK